MKSRSFFVIFFLLAALLMLSTQALGMAPANETDKPKTPEATATPKIKQTEKADVKATDTAEKDALKATQQAEKDALKATQQAEKEKLDKGPKENYRGILTAVSADSLTLIDADSGETISIALVSATNIQIPGMNGANAAALTIDSQVTVQAVLGEDGSLTARMVHGVPSQPTKAHFVGTVTAVSDSGVTIQDGEGNSHTYIITPETQILYKNAKAKFEIGAVVTIIGLRSPDGVSVATGIVVHGLEDSGETDD